MGADEPNAESSKIIWHLEFAIQTGGPMNSRQENFIREYLVDMDGPAAARRAGFSPKHAKATAGRLLQDPQISEAIRLAQEKHRQESELSPRRVLDSLGQIAFGEAQGSAVSNKIRCLELLAKLLGMFEGNGAMEPVTVVEDV